MYARLIFRNVRRSSKDYLIYLVTLTICVMLFYAFLSISSRYYRPDLGTEYDVTVLSDGMKIAVCAVALLLLFLIRYVNGYMLKRRQKEFAVESVIGMEAGTVARMFLAETLVMGALSIVLGILLGAVCSQFVTAMLLHDYGQDFELTWTLFPDTALMTAGFFVIIFLLVGGANVRTIKKIRIIDMINAERRNEPPLKKNRFMPVVTLIWLFVLVWMSVSGIRLRYYYFDSRFDVPVHIMFWANILVPAAGALCGAALFASGKRGKQSCVAFECAAAILAAFSNAAVLMMRGPYMLSYDAGIMNKYMLFLLADMLYLICGIVYLSNSGLVSWKEKSPENRYRGTSLFLLGQITSKLAANTKTMILICITLGMAVVLFLISPVLTGWSLGYLDVRSLYDIQISSRYNDVMSEEDLYQGDYEPVTEVLREKGIETAEECTFSLYLPEREEFHSRIKWEFPVAAMSLSDYNGIREMLGYEPVSLGEDEFTTQWQSIASEEEKAEFLTEHQQVGTDAGVLSLAENSCYEEPIGETVYNSYTNVVYIFPDSVCEDLMGVMRNRYIMTERPVPFADAQEIARAFAEVYPEDPGESGSGEGMRDTGMQYTIRLNTLQVNSLLANNFMLKAVMTYGGIVLMVICLTVLSLQQLLDASQYRYRFSVLRSLGVEEREIRRLVFRQLGVWFGLPVALALVISCVVVAGFIQTFSAEISAYIGAETLLMQLGITVLILAMLLVCYFISTWILFRRAVGEAQ
ncbi:ABC transporter permease [Ruminococcus sp. CLA-AA-H200]|uniref:ABC transporter permease n=1 Tax=Ruminococcus turbiniformis TaxID=2881258 RepID=A0ABS8FTY3_9FIRM|nr:ABC transporter permease [Ruminococcus turbiniformis]MCC2253506.1 ABC transporter permease [Ruminococcus turbiniformis]